MKKKEQFKQAKGEKELVHQAGEEEMKKINSKLYVFAMHDCLRSEVLDLVQESLNKVYQQGCTIGWKACGEKIIREMKRNM